MNRVSVVIPTFNRADSVVGAVASVLEQTLPAYEVIVVDDCSTDSTAEALEKFRARIQVVKPGRNSERGAARNLGAAVATGEILAFLDSDDRWSRDKLAVQAPLSVLGPTVTGYEVVDAAGSVGRAIVPRPRVQSLVMTENCFGISSSLMLPRTAFEDVGGYPTDRILQGSEDWLLLARLHRRGYLIRVVENLAVKYYVHDGASTQDPDNLARSMWAACGWFEAELPSADAIDVARRVTTATAVAKAYAATGVWSKAARWTLAAVRTGRVVDSFHVLLGVGRSLAAKVLGGLLRRQ